MRLSPVLLVLALLLSGCGSGSGATAEQLSHLRLENQELSRRLADASDHVQALSSEQPPQIESITFVSAQGESLAKNGGWVELDAHTTIRVALSGRTTMVDAVFTPTGSGTYMEQRVIGSVTIDPGQREAAIQWDVPSETLGHLWIMAFNGRSARRSEPLNVIRGAGQP